MEWLNGLFTIHSALQTIVVLSLICCVGIILGRIRIKGISLGVAFANRHTHRNHDGYS